MVGTSSYESVKVGRGQYLTKVQECGWSRDVRTLGVAWTTIDVRPVDGNLDWELKIIAPKALRANPARVRAQRCPRWLLHRRRENWFAVLTSLAVVRLVRGHYDDMSQ